MCKCFGVVQKQFGLVFAKKRCILQHFHTWGSERSAWRNRCPRLIFSDSFIILWSKQSRLARLAGRPADCSVSLQLSDNPSVSARFREVGQINSTAQMFYILDSCRTESMGAYCRAAQGWRQQLRCVSPWIYYSPTPWGTKQFDSFKQIVAASCWNEQTTKRSCCFSHSAYKVVNFRTAVGCRRLQSTLQAVMVIVNKLMKTRMVKESRDDDSIRAEWLRVAARCEWFWRFNMINIQTRHSADLLRLRGAAHARRVTIRTAAQCDAAQTFSVDVCFRTRTRVSGRSRARSTSIVYDRDNSLNSRLDCIQLLTLTANDRLFSF